MVYCAHNICLNIDLVEEIVNDYKRTSLLLGPFFGFLVYWPGLSLPKI